MNPVESNMPDPQREKETLPMIKKLDWDSEFFGLNIASINTESNDIDFGSIENFVKENKIEFVQACCQTSDRTLINKLEKEGFNFCDLRVTYSIDLRKISPEKGKIIFADENDIPAIKEIAGKVFLQDSRYNYEKFDIEKVKEFYQTWAEKAVYGTFDDFCLKSKDNGSLTGFISGKFREGIANIGLVGVSENYQGKGVGTELMKGFFDYCLKKGVSNVEVVTEGRNLRANNYYIKSGYGLKSIESWYYKSY